MRRITALLMLLFFIQAATLSGQDNDVIVKKTVDYAKEVQKLWQIPGMAISIVKDGKMIWSGGLGVKEMCSSCGDSSGKTCGENSGKSCGENCGDSCGEKQVDANTLFQIGSVSKSFTAAVMASLVDEGKVKWEDTVKNILPDFKMYDKWVESNLQVKDIMTHHSGLQGQLGTYIPNMGYGREDIWNMLPLLKPKYSFRGSYEYNNITFIIASKIIEKLTGKSWEDNVRERIFKPLGMSSSRVIGDEFKAAQNVSTPHEFVYKKGRMLSDTTWVDSVAVNALYGDEQALHWLTVVGPAGSISSTANDMAKYTLFHLNKGLADGKKVISQEQANYLRKGHTITSQDSSRITLYGHCWFIEQNSRYRVIFHTGTTWGFTTLCAYFPEMDLGITILVNSEAPAFPRYAIMRRMIDLYKGFPDKDYNKLFYEEWLASARKGMRTADKKAAEEAKEASPDIKLLTGTYDKGALFGKAVVTLEKSSESDAGNAAKAQQGSNSAVDLKSPVAHQGSKSAVDLNVAENLYITVGPKGWKSKLTHKNGNEFIFRMDGNEFKVKFVMDSKSGKFNGLDIDFGYTENFGVWSKLN
ncbi:MAG: serine hydrolase domain-containing protein [Bacteroidales bacterium]|nr:serine hydrolase domain-containing protein [Bacteroidales bacterium]